MSNEILLAVSVAIASVMLIALGVVLLIIQRKKQKREKQNSIRFFISLLPTKKENCKNQ